MSNSCTSSTWRGMPRVVGVLRGHEIERVGEGYEIELRDGLLQAISECWRDESGDTSRPRVTRKTPYALRH